MKSNNKNQHSQVCYNCRIKFSNWIIKRGQRSFQSTLIKRKTKATKARIAWNSLARFLISRKPYCLRTTFSTRISGRWSLILHVNASDLCQYKDTFNSNNFKRKICKRTKMVPTNHCQVARWFLLPKSPSKRKGVRKLRKWKKQGKKSWFNITNLSILNFRKKWIKSKAGD